MKITDNYPLSVDRTRKKDKLLERFLVQMKTTNIFCLILVLTATGLTHAADDQGRIYDHIRP